MKGPGKGTTSRTWQLVQKNPLVVAGAVLFVGLIVLLISCTSSRSSTPSLQRVSSADAGSIAFPTKRCYGISDYYLKKWRNHTDIECRNWMDPSKRHEAFTSQFSQDAFFWYNYFQCMDGPGVYVDVGAYDPRSLSNTYFFDKCLGWKGICVEAEPTQASKFIGTRGCSVVGQAVSIEAGVAHLTSSGHGGTIRKDATGPEVKLTTIRKILEDHKVNVVDFMSVDVESFELEVLLTVPWDKVQIRTMAVENNELRLDVDEYLYDHGFVKLYHFGMDDIYLWAGEPLWMPPNLNSIRTGTHNYRHDSLSTKVYSHKVLYKGWDYVMEHIKEGAKVLEERE